MRKIRKDILNESNNLEAIEGVLIQEGLKEDGAKNKMMILSSAEPSEKREVSLSLIKDESIQNL